MQEKLYDHRIKLEAKLMRAEKMEEEKNAAMKEYDLKNKRGLTSQISQTTKKGRPPIQSGKAIFKSKRDMAAEAEMMMD